MSPRAAILVAFVQAIGNGMHEIFGAYITTQVVQMLDLML
jgi:hypothetical protein